MFQFPHTLLSLSLLFAPLLPGKTPDKTPPVLAGKPSWYPDNPPSPAKPHSSHYPGSEKLIRSTDELHRSRRLSNVDVVWI